MFSELLISNLEIGFSTIPVEYTTIMYVVLSIVMTMISIVFVGMIFKKRLAGLKGANHLFLISTTALILIEVAYLGSVFEIFDVALEVLASIGVAFAAIGFGLRNPLKNMVAGIGIYLNRELNLGDTIEIDGKRGVITNFSLTRILAFTENGDRLLIPNQKMEEEVVLIMLKTNVEDLTKIGNVSRSMRYA